MRFVLSLAFVLALCLGLVAGARADKEDKKAEQTLEGKITCPKCDLKKEKKCGTVIVLKKDGKESIVWFDADSNKKYHGEICQGGKAGKVTGAVSEKDGKQWIKVTKLDWTEK